MTKFIFFLTHHDVTVENAMEVFEEVKNTGVENIGFKNVGLPREDLQSLANSIKSEGIHTFMEIVTYEKEKHIQAVRDTGEFDVDYLIGGMPLYTKKTIEIMREEDLKFKYFPYVGHPVGHPCLLRGTLDYIIEDTKRTYKLGDEIGGVNLLAYRYRDGNPDELLQKFEESVDVPTIVAGNIDSFERIDRVVKLGSWGFTIGSAIFEKKLTSGSLKDQVTAVLERIKKIEGQKTIG